jgi:hypothetical protein
MASWTNIACLTKSDGPIAQPIFQPVQLSSLPDEKTVIVLAQFDYE